MNTKTRIFIAKVTMILSLIITFGYTSVQYCFGAFNSHLVFDVVVYLYLGMTVLVWIVACLKNQKEYSDDAMPFCVMSNVMLAACLAASGLIWHALRTNGVQSAQAKVYSVELWLCYVFISLAVLITIGMVKEKG